MSDHFSLNYSFIHNIKTNDKKMFALRQILSSVPTYYRLAVVFLVVMATQLVAKPLQHATLRPRALAAGIQQCNVSLIESTANIKLNFCGVKTFNTMTNTMSMDNVREKLEDVAIGLDGLHFLAQDNKHTADFYLQICRAPDFNISVPLLKDTESVPTNYLDYLDNLAPHILSHFRLLYNLMVQLNNINTTTLTNDEPIGHFIQQTNETLCDLSMLLQHPLKGAYSVNISVGDAVSTSVCNHDTESGDYCDYSCVHCKISIVMSVSETVTKELTQVYQELATTFTALEEHQSENNDYYMIVG